MTLYTQAGDLPRHQYVRVDRAVTRKDSTGFEPAVWFALVSIPGRTWGCHLMLENGAVYRNVPLHAIAHGDDPSPWTPATAQIWDCYGPKFSTIEYHYLSGLDVEIRHHGPARYLFTAVPIGDAFTAASDQAKEFSFVALENGRFGAYPTDWCLFTEKSFTVPGQATNDIRRQREVYSCE